MRCGDAWTEQTKLMASDGADQDYFARSVSLAGDTVVVGAADPPAVTRLPENCRRAEKGDVKYELLF